MQPLESHNQLHDRCLEMTPDYDDCAYERDVGDDDTLAYMPNGNESHSYAHEYEDGDDDGNQYPYDDHDLGPSTSTAVQPTSSLITHHADYTRPSQAIADAAALRR